MTSRRKPKKRPSQRELREAFRLVYKTELGAAYEGESEKIDLLCSVLGRRRAQLIFTSPPFPLNTKKRYGNLKGDQYIDWLCDVTRASSALLRPAGSIVIEMGNAWVQGSPTMSTLPIKALMAVQERLKLNLCQEFIWYNPARLPSPAQWVTVERIRVKDAFTRFWWLSPVERPRGDNRLVKRPYSSRMLELLKGTRSTAGSRPSQHKVGERSFLTDNGGAIAANVMTCANTRSRDRYLQYCATHGLHPHPARMPEEIVSFFVQFLTRRGDLVLDPFAGSNTTGSVAEALGRRWLSVERRLEYLEGSLGRFDKVKRSRRRDARAAHNRGR